MPEGLSGQEAAELVEEHALQETLRKEEDME